MFGTVPRSVATPESASTSRTDCPETASHPPGAALRYLPWLGWVAKAPVAMCR
jgi:hypothetical protein